MDTDDTTTGTAHRGSHGRDHGGQDRRSPDRGGPSRGGCNVARLRGAGLRPTRQRVALAHLIFDGGDRHLTAEQLHAEACAAALPMSLATAYNALHPFTQAGLLRSLGLEGRATHFDTNTGDHHHFLTERGEVIDIPPGAIDVTDLPEPPEGMEIAQVDVVVRLRPAR